MYKFFLIKLYLKLLSQLFELKTFDEVSTELKKEKTIRIMNRFLNIVYDKKISKKASKIMLTIFISSKFTNVLSNHINIKDDPISYSIHKTSIKISNLLKNILHSKSNRFMMDINIHILKKQGRNLFCGYRIWQKADKEKILHELILIYYENYEFSLKHPHLKKTIEEEQQEIINKAASLVPAIDEEYFKLCLDDYLKNKNKLEKMISKNMEKAYWDSITNELKKNPPNFMVIIPLLEETRALLKECVPNRIDIHQYINEYIDIEFIEHMIKNNAIDDKYVKNMAQFIYSYLKDFQSKSEDGIMEIWFNDIIELLDKGNYSGFFTEFFKTIIDKINNILVKINSIHS
jgi:hypothetical protein